MTVQPKIFLVGGAVRDHLRGEKPKDLDYAVEGPASFEEMEAWLVSEGYKIVVSSPENLTVRACNVLSEKYDDFVLCRVDSEESDGRRPKKVEPAGIMGDLARRDFTINAMAYDTDGNLLDPFDGQKDLRHKLIRCVGSPMEKFEHDGLRILRAFRFSITLGFQLDPTIRDILSENELVDYMGNVASERRREELAKMFNHSTIDTLRFLVGLSNPKLRDAVLEDIRLQPTLKEKIK